MARGALHALIAAALLAAGCDRPAARSDGPAEPRADGPPWFEDVTDRVGLNFVHDAGPPGTFMPQALGSGAALFDCDGDGRLDVLLLQNGGPASQSVNRLYRQRLDGTFTDASAGSGLDFAGHNMGVAIGDVNNDGRPDVLVTQVGGIKLLINTGDGKFTDVTDRAGLANPAWGTSAAFLDYDRDGRLDLVVVSYVDYDPTFPCTSRSGAPDYCPPRTFPGRVSKLFRNVGGPGGVRFEDVTVASGLGRVPGPGLGVVCADFDGDGWPDVFVANDGQPNRLWINQKDGTFKDEAVARAVAYNAMGAAEAGMGVALGDVDGDGLFDLVVTHLTEETNTVWRQGPRGLFRDATAGSGTVAPGSRGTGFGVVLADFDHDGSPDLAVANGRVARGPVTNPALGPHWGLYAERNLLFANDGAGKLRNVSARNPALCGTPNVARGLAVGDFDNDGAPDLLVTTVGGPARLYRNVAPDRGHWLAVRALDPAARRDAYGAEVRVRAGDRRWTRWVNPAGSYLCSNDPRAHFGLGSAAQVDGIEVTWPDGTVEAFPGGAADRQITVTRGKGQAK